MNVSRYLNQRLADVGVRHLFGVPGDYVLDYLDQVLAGPLQWVGTCNELNAGYAADGYARMTGAGAAAVTYGVGGFSILNAVAGAYAERVPLILISGAPHTARRQSGALVHHLVSDYGMQLEIFRHVTVDAAVLTDPETAPAVIDRVIGNAITQRLPAYLEIPLDMALRPCGDPGPWASPAARGSDEGALRECVAETLECIDRAARVMVLAGMEVSRFQLGPDLLKLVEGAEWPYCTMLSSKSVLPELHPQFAGIYQGKWSRPVVRDQVEQADCLLSLGVWMTDLDTGMFSFQTDPNRMIRATGGEVRIRHHHYPRVQLGDFIRSLAAGAKPRSYLASHPSQSFQPKGAFRADENRSLTAPRLYERLSLFLNDEMVLLSEPGDAFCAAPEFRIEEAENFIVQPFYASIGYCLPAALGVALARPAKRPVVLTGDGAFQMTAQEFGTLARHSCAAIVIVLNNQGYLIERVLHEDGLYNDIANWNYASLPEALGGRGGGVKVSTEGELERALDQALRVKDRPVLLEMQLPGRECSEGLARLGASIKQANKR